jgi:arsenate reductase
MLINLAKDPMAQTPRELSTPIDSVSRPAPSPRPGTGQGVGGRKALAEFLGTALLVTAIVGSGIAAQRLSPGDVGLELLENTLATAAALAAIILAVGPVSGGHLNPVITMVDRFFGGVSTQDALVYGVAQFAGDVTGAIVANTMFGDTVISLSTRPRASRPHLFAEAVATFGLVLVVFGLKRSGRARLVPFAVGAYIGAAYWSTTSTGLASPAVALGRMLSNTFAGIAPGSPAPFLGFELIGGAVGACCLAALYPKVRPGTQDAAIPQPGAR